MNLLKELEGKNRIAISGHVRPDGDCVGSCLAMYNYLKQAKPDAKIRVLLEQPSTIFSILAGYEDIDATFSCKEPVDAYIALDAGDLERLGDAKPLFEAAPLTLCFDHHLSNQGYAQKNVIVPDASSTCEILFDAFEKEYITEDVAKALYTGIMHDTGVFQYSCMKKKTFGIVGELVEYGFDASTIIRETFYEKTYVQNQILGRALLESIIFMDGRCIASCVDKRMMDFYGASTKDFEGIVNQLLVTKGVEVAIFLYQSGTLEYKVSMRSKGKVDVAQVAMYFNGGGHERAAGCTMMGTYRDVLNNLSKHIEKQLS